MRGGGALCDRLASAVSVLHSGNFVGTNFTDGRAVSNHSPGKVATANAKTTGTKLANAHPAIFPRRRSRHPRRVVFPRAIKGHNVHSNASSVRIVVRCHQVIPSA